MYVDQLQVLRGASSCPGAAQDHAASAPSVIAWLSSCRCRNIAACMPSTGGRGYMHLLRKHQTQFQVHTTAGCIRSLSFLKHRCYAVYRRKGSAIHRHAHKRVCTFQEGCWYTASQQRIFIREAIHLFSYCEGVTAGSCFMPYN